MNVFISAISSDIGAQLALKYRDSGHAVTGTYRSATALDALQQREGIDLIPCDVTDSASVRRVAERCAKLGKPWDVFVSAVGQLSPVGGFFDCDFDEWTASVMLNSVLQLRLLHALYPCRREGVVSKVAFLVGGGVNGPFTNYSAYTLGKVMLIKICELLDDEYPAIHAIAVGTGWVNTKIHQQTLRAETRAGANYRRTFEFVSSAQQGTSYGDIFDCIEWCFGQERQVSSGRNFSVVHDAWRSGADGLVSELLRDASKFKLRRRGG